MSAFGIREAMNSILSGCSGNVSVAVVQKSQEEEIHRKSSSSRDSNRNHTTILVALDASNNNRGISACAIKWATGNVLQPGDCLLILAIHPKIHQPQAGWKMRGFPKLAGECAMDQCTNTTNIGEDPEDAISRMALKLCDPKKVHVRVKLITEKNMVAVEARKTHASWVVLDRNLKKEANFCVQTVPCNVVVVNNMGFRILCLKNFRDKSTGKGILLDTTPSSTQVQHVDDDEGHENKKHIISKFQRGPNKTNSNINSSPEIDTSFTGSNNSTSTSLSSSSSSYDPQHDNTYKAANFGAASKPRNSNLLPDSLENTTTKTRTTTTTKCLDEQLLSQTKSILSDAEKFIRQVTRSISPQDITDHFSSLQLEFEDRNRRKRHLSSGNNGSRNLVTIDEAGLPSTSCKRDRFGDHLSRTSRVRKAVSLPLIKRSVAGSPPLCSICTHASPDFGRPPKRFTFEELEFATGSFCSANFLAEGGYGSVHRGVLADGIPVAVKQYKLASSQGDLEFCSEVEVLSCAQHRNVVMLIGYCIEENRRLLVYEFICNGSLDSHLYGQNQNSVLKWSSRHKIATGAARGLRYLHEECRVGCIVHRDLRPNNILLTHDFEPMVGDFGLARWQPDGDLGVETRVIGTFGYLAPEYTQTGQITEKADVYSFGVVLLELVTGRKAIDISRPRGQQCLTEWARPLLEEQAHYEMIDPLLQNNYNQYEVFCMFYTASLCTQKDPQQRPRMSQVLRMLEGDLNISRNSSPMRSCSTSSGRLAYSPRSSTARMSPSSRSSSSRGLLSPSSMCDDSLSQTVTSYMSAHPIIGCDTKLSHQALKAAYKQQQLDPALPANALV